MAPFPSLSQNTLYGACRCSRSRKDSTPQPEDISSVTRADTVPPSTGALREGRCFQRTAQRPQGDRDPRLRKRSSPSRSKAPRRRRVQAASTACPRKSDFSRLGTPTFCVCARVLKDGHMDRHAHSGGCSARHCRHRQHNDENAKSIGVVSLIAMMIYSTSAPPGGRALLVITAAPSIRRAR